MKIYTPEEIFHGRIPSKQKIINVYEETKKIIHKMVEENQLLGATSFGSIPEGRFSINSDDDWIFLFENHIKILESDDFSQIYQIHNENFIDFNPPITTLDFIKNKFHHLIVFNDIKKQINRDIIGLDPLNTYYNYSHKIDYLIGINCEFHDFNKYYLEPLIFNYNNKDNISNFVTALELAFNGASNLRRNMFSCARNFITDKALSQDLNQIYMNIYKDLLSEHSLDFSRRIDEFKQNYIQSLEKSVEVDSSMFVVNEYREFLRKNDSFIIDGYKFCHENLKIYQNYLATNF